MPAVATPIKPETNLPPLDPAGDAEFYCEMLDEIMEAAADFARAIRQNLRDDPKTATPEIAIALDRVARIVRRCILLVAKLTEGKPARTTNARARSEARARVRNQVKAAQATAPPADQVQDQADPARTESPDRSDSTDRLDRLDTLPPGTVPEIIAGLQQDLTRVATQLGQPGAHPEPPTPPAPTAPDRPSSPSPASAGEGRGEGVCPQAPPPNPARAKGSG